MVNTSLTQMPSTSPASWQERVQVALAVGNESLLRNLLTDSWPPVVHPSQVGSVRAEVAIPLEGTGHLVDSVLKFERIVCALAGSRPEVPPEPVIHDHHHYQFLTGCVSGLQTLAHNESLSQVLSLLSKVCFSEADIHQILNLPYHAWHKSWWYQADAEGNLTIPFQRFIRSRRYGDGTLTLHYKDYYAQEPPQGFLGYLTQLPVVIRRAEESFMATLARINCARQSLGVQHALLLLDGVSPIEIEGFANQDVSLYSTQSMSTSPSADCSRCAQTNCPLQGQSQSPVLACRGFLPQ